MNFSVNSKCIFILLFQLKDFEPDDPVAFMKELEKEADFKSMIIEFDEKTSNNKFQCLIQLTFEPPQVLFGVGDTKEEAKMRALRDVFKFFKLLADQGKLFATKKVNNRQVSKPSEPETSEDTESVHNLDTNDINDNKSSLVSQDVS